MANLLAEDGSVREGMHEATGLTDPDTRGVTRLII
jgi:hypothetical protein